MSLINFAHATRAEMFENQVSAEVLSFIKSGRRFVADKAIGHFFNRQAADEILVRRFLVRLDQPFDFLAKIAVSTTLLLHVRSTNFAVEGDCRFEDATYLVPAVGVQVGAPPLSWR